MSAGDDVVRRATEYAARVNSGDPQLRPAREADAKTAYLAGFVDGVMTERRSAIRDLETKAQWELET